MTDLALRWDGADAFAVDCGEVELFRYVFRPDLAPVEAPQPYFHPIRTLAGEVVTLHRPWDHPWHKGLALSMPNVGDANFWGGGMQILRPDGTIDQVENNGSQRHQEFDLVDESRSRVEIGERLRWVTEDGEHWVDERRRIAVRADPDERVWFLSFGTELRNVSGRPIPFGSPSTNGRPDAGYSGLFWRGTRELAHGRIMTADGPAGPAAMGARARWLAYAGRHDASHGSSTLVFVDSRQNPRHPNPWFVRSTPYACVSSAPFFHSELVLAPDTDLTLRYTIVVAAGDWDESRIDELLTGVTAW